MLRPLWGAHVGWRGAGGCINPSMCNFFFRRNVSTKGVRNDRFERRSVRRFLFLFERVTNGDFCETQIIYLRVCPIEGVVGFEANNWKYYRENRGLFDAGSREYQSKL